MLCRARVYMLSCPPDGIPTRQEFLPKTVITLHVGLRRYMTDTPMQEAPPQDAVTPRPLFNNHGGAATSVSMTSSYR